MDSLQKQVNEVLAQYTKDVDSTMEKVFKDTAKEAKQKLQEDSPGHGAYAKGWSIRQTKGNYVIYNKEYYLTHLLENGHDVVAYGRKVGHASPQKHIAPVEKWVKEEVMKRLEDEL